MTQICLDQIGPAQISAPEARPNQTRPGQVGTGLRVLAPPLVRNVHPLLEPRDMVPVGHERPPLVNGSFRKAKLEGMMVKAWTESGQSLAVQQRAFAAPVGPRKTPACREGRQAESLDKEESRAHA